MYRIILPLLLFSLSFGKAFSQCAETPEPKVLLVGDSWAWFMNTEATINNVFKTWGHSNFRYVSNSTLAVNGAQTDDVMKPATEAEILNQLNLNPSIEIVHLSIGGNDLLGDWKVSNTQAQTDSLFDNVFGSLDSIFRFIKSCKPGIRIFWSGYVYPNFSEVITSGTLPLGSNHPFYGTWNDMEQPTFIQINTVLNAASARMEAYASADPQIDFINCSGLMQYIYGQNPALGIAPGGTYPPYSVPLPLGDPNYPSPKSTMRDYAGITKDCYHLSTQAYKDFISYHTQKFYHKFLMDNLYLLSENNAQTGTVSSTGNIADSLSLGASGSEQFATVLSFNTTSMADTTLSKASIFLRRKSLTGTNPIGNSLVVSVKNGSFGASANVEAADFTAAGDAAATPCLFGSNTANGDWIRLDLPLDILTHISNSAPTQFVITSPGSTGKVNFYNSTDPDFAPVLNLKYGELPSSINESTINRTFNIYPNPTNDKLTIETGAETITRIEVSNLLGEVVLVPQVHHNTIDISSLAKGMYLLNIATPSGKSTQRVIKE
jgi:hypothetical protein